MYTKNSDEIQSLPIMLFIFKYLAVEEVRPAKKRGHLRLIITEDIFERQRLSRQRAQCSVG